MVVEIFMGIDAEKPIDIIVVLGGNNYDQRASKE